MNAVCLFLLLLTHLCYKNNQRGEIKGIQVIVIANCLWKHPRKCKRSTLPLKRNHVIIFIVILLHILHISYLRSSMKIHKKNLPVNQHPRKRMSSCGLLVTHYPRGDHHADNIWLDVNGIMSYVAGVSGFFYLMSYLGESHILCYVTIELEIVYFHGCIAFHDVNISQCSYSFYCGGAFG